MKTLCPNPACERREKIYKNGSYARKCDGKRVQRFWCQSCDQHFSQATHELEFRQRVRHVNSKLEKLLCSKVSLQRCAEILSINPKTVARRLEYLSLKAQMLNEYALGKRDPVKDVQFDDLITKEKSKCLPLTVPLAVEAKTRLLLAVDVGKIPAFGHLAAVSVEKYGPRKNEHRAALGRVFDRLSSLCSERCNFASDEHQNYPPLVQKYFPQATHKQYKGVRGCIAGQGELKKTQRDPLFWLNHTCAVLRDSIGRLVRKTWGISQKKERLLQHLRIFQWFHNRRILEKLGAPISAPRGSG